MVGDADDSSYVGCPSSIPDSPGTIAYMALNAISGLLSIIGSSLIVFIIIRNRGEKLARVHNRLILAMSIVDIFNSFALGLSIVPTPSNETPCSMGLGNITTCTIQGFFITLGFAVPSYNAHLCVYYLLMIRYNVSEEKIAKTYELWMHLFALAGPLAAGIVGAMQGIFHADVAHCWVGDKCVSRGTCLNGNMFGRGEWLLRLTSVYFFIVFLTIAISLLGTFLMIRERSAAVRQYEMRLEVGRPSRRGSRERRLSEQSIQSTTENIRQHTNNVSLTRDSAMQSLLYVAGFLITYVWACLGVMVVLISRDPTAAPTVFHYLNAFFLPLHGFWNCIIYLRPRINNIRRANRNISFCTALRKVIFTVNVQSRVEITRRRSSNTRASAVLTGGTTAFLRGSATNHSIIADAAAVVAIDIIVP
mmetsp:Transcript_62134/g.73586  ORF Transcript_62134/g.73586 Transcript_62134/m.73586 type:complete len:419 (+) Transcript_62134:78-1334(+)